ncbi:hypothetical protein [Mycobacterium sp. 852014-52144_SCH5372336]|uniref:hypothetical protein n=1 Tax=Mycobacterium sp. 852014-52144_SCH5372336 TaxID=1834115 RepID=UPI00080142AF|nr:hypothetical protein [Mycobacterium sp. 852014-52144_SCH5372336]OBB75905.1 hypothetical protein A5759_06575 [Mycobacterium sp. 852014-52144_SCH5372336]
MSTHADQPTLGGGHELLYVILSEPTGQEPDAISPRLGDHLRFLAQLSSDGVLVMSGPPETSEGFNTSSGLYVLRAE